MCALSLWKYKNKHKERKKITEFINVDDQELRKKNRSSENAINFVTAAIVMHHVCAHRVIKIIIKKGWFTIFLLLFLSGRFFEATFSNQEPCLMFFFFDDPMKCLNYFMRVNRINWKLWLYCIIFNNPLKFTGLYHEYCILK